jgi:EamA domain-containing membrane protein RarD
VFLFGEPFTFAHAVLFACLWGGIALIAIETFVRRAKGQPKEQEQQGEQGE